MPFRSLFPRSLARRDVWAGALLIVAPLLQGLNLLFVGDETSRAWLSNLAQAGSAGVAAVLAVAAWRKLRAEADAAARAWGFIGVGSCCWAAGAVAFMWVEVLLQEAPYPGVPDLFFMLFYPLALVGLALLPVTPPTRREAWNNALDLSALGLVAATIIWHFDVSLLVRTLAESVDAAVLVSLVYTLLDTILLMAFFSRLVQRVGRGRQFLPILLLMVGGFFLIASDLLQGYVTTYANFTSGSPIDLGWVLFSTFVGFSALSLLRSSPDRAEGDDAGGREFTRQAWVVGVTYLWVVLVLGLLIWALFTPAEVNPAILIGGAVGAAALAIARQVRSVQEAARLNADLREAHAELDRKVQERTAELRQNADLLRASERKYRSLVDGLMDIVFSVTADGTISFVSPQVTRYGFTVGDLVGRPFAQVIDATDRPRIEAGFGEAVASGDAVRTVFRITAAGGAAVSFEANVQPMHDDAGRITGLFGILRDVTERERAEEERRSLQSQLIQAQKMEAVGQLAGGVAHDFNNILTAILLQLAMLRDEPDLPPLAREGLVDLENEARRAANLTRQLLVFSRRQVLQTRPLELNALLGNLLKMLRRLIGEHIQLEFAGGAEDLWLEADAGMIEQVVVNLVVNARDAMPGGGRVTLTTAAARIGTGPTGPHPEARPGLFARLTVEDHGLGMDQATLGRIFEPFFTTKEAGRGTGLGLATVYGIVKQHRGWIEVESRVGQGTRFDVYLPRRDAAGSEAPAPVRRPVAGGRERILVVEDEASVRRSLLTMLSQLGYSVREAKDSADALRQWELHGSETDLVLADVVVPGGMSGIELAAVLRRRGSRVPVVLMSGYNAEMVAKGIPQGPGMRFLQKPFEAGELGRIIRESLEDERSEHAV